MILLPRNAARAAATAAFALLAGCAQMNQPAPPPAVAYNPPAAAVTELSTVETTRYRMNFASGSTRMDAEGAALVARIADAMQANPALIATLIGSADPAASASSSAASAAMSALGSGGGGT